LSIFSIKVICLGYHFKDVGKELKGNNSLGVESEEKIFCLGGSLTAEFHYGEPMQQADVYSYGDPLRRRRLPGSTGITPLELGCTDSLGTPIGDTEEYYRRKYPLVFK